MSWANLLLGALVHVAKSDATANRIFYCFLAHVGTVFLPLARRTWNEPQAATRTWNEL
jgi:hypothetical protein